MHDLLSQADAARAEKYPNLVSPRRLKALVVCVPLSLSAHHIGKAFLAPDGHVHALSSRAS